MQASTPSRPVPAQAGIGLRLPHHALVLAEQPDAAWLEVHPENYMADARALDELERIGASYPLSLHATGLSLGSADGVDDGHLARLVRLERQLAPGLVSDHLAWNSQGGRHLPDLLPLPYTDEALQATCRNVARVQEALGRPILVENPSTYLAWSASTWSEPRFLAELARRTGCGVLLDLNNVYVSARNQRLEPIDVLGEWLAALPAGSVGEIHLAGHALTRTASGTELRIDDHGSPVGAGVWALYERTLARLGPVPTLIEWDTRLPGFDALQHEAALAQQRLGALHPAQAAVHAG